MKIQYNECCICGKKGIQGVSFGLGEFFTTSNKVRKRHNKKVNMYSGWKHGQEKLAWCKKHGENPKELRGVRI